LPQQRQPCEPVLQTSLVLLWTELHR